MSTDGITTIGFIGAGKIGSALARLAITAGYDVVLSNSRTPETLADLVAELGPKASAALPAEAAAAGDLVVVSIPLRAYLQVPVEPTAGKIVIDTDNYYPQRDGQIAPLDAAETTSSTLLQEHLPTSKVVKLFNNISFAQLPTDGTANGTSGRRALPLAGDDIAVKATVSALLDEFGFDAVDSGTLADSWRQEPGTPCYGAKADAAGMRDLIAAATR